MYYDARCLRAIVCDNLQLTTVPSEPTMRTMTGRERLKHWLKRSNVNQREAARIIGIHFTHLSQILSGRRSPGLANAVVIERETGIPVEAWLPSGEGKRGALVSIDGRKSRIGKA